jgi:hypothetical protein
MFHVSEPENISAAENQTDANWTCWSLSFRWYSNTAMRISKEGAPISTHGRRWTLCADCLHMFSTPGSYRYTNQPISLVIITNIHVKTPDKWMKGNIRKYAEGRSIFWEDCRSTVLCSLASALHIAASIHLLLCTGTSSIALDSFKLSIICNRTFLSLPPYAVQERC